jgi:hypothetical protein
MMWSTADPFVIKGHTKCVPQEFYRGADKVLLRPGRNQATATNDVDVHISYL